MLTLYYKPACPYCQLVLGEAEEMGLQLNLKNVGVDTVVVEELIARGGKNQVPYLVDIDREVEMYESNDIIRYLRYNYSQVSEVREHNGLRIHASDESCDTCQ